MNFGVKSTLTIIKDVFSYHVFIKLLFFQQYNHERWKWQENFQYFLHQFAFELNWIQIQFQYILIQINVFNSIQEFQFN
jgi:hypothetical protein